jgi:D-arabinose 1-dehydrogenase-like Zn-dependent alcohol dehydrogenase
MKVDQYYTTGKMDIFRQEYDKPNHTHNQIEVQSIYTGVCSSDVAMYKGEFPLLPTHMHGHESLGKVIAVGSSISNVDVGDYVATRGEPAYAERYNASRGTFVKVPEAKPKYIIEPVACAINIALSVGTIGRNKSVCIIGTGFLARVLYQYIKFNLNTNIDVIGKSDMDFWEEQSNVIVKDKPSREYDIVFDLSSNPKHFENINVKPNGHYVVSAEKSTPVSTDFSKFLWNNIKIHCPSPRDEKFLECMRIGVVMVREGSIEVADMWTHSYNSSNQVAIAFAENINKKPGMGRSYIEWS